MQQVICLWGVNMCHACSLVMCVEIVRIEMELEKLPEVTVTTGTATSPASLKGEHVTPLLSFPLLLPFFHTEYRHALPSVYSHSAADDVCVCVCVYDRCGCGHGFIRLDSGEDGSGDCHCSDGAG